MWDSRRGRIRAVSWAVARGAITWLDRPRLEGPVGRPRGGRLATRPVGRGPIDCRQHLAARTLGARFDLHLGRLPDALLALLGLRPDPLGLGFERLLGADPGFLGGLAFDLLDQRPDLLPSLAAHVLGPLHHALLDLGLEPDRQLVRLAGRGFCFGGALLGRRDALVRLTIDLLPHPLEGALGPIAGLLGVCRARFRGLPLLALGRDPLATLLADLAQGAHRTVPGLRSHLLEPRLGPRHALLADPHPLERLPGGLVQLLAGLTDRLQLCCGLAHEPATYYRSRSPFHPSAFRKLQLRRIAEEPSGGGGTPGGGSPGTPGEAGPETHPRCPKSTAATAAPAARA